MTLGFNGFKENIMGTEKLAESKDRNDESAPYSFCARSHRFGKGEFRKYSLPLISIAIFAVVLLILPAFAKADSNESTDIAANTSINQSQSAYLSGFNEGYVMGEMRILAQNNATITEEYNVLVQQHNDLINKTLSEEKAEYNQLAMAPMPSAAISKKPTDPWEL